MVEIRFILQFFLPKFLMTSSSLAGCLEPGTPPSHPVLRSPGHQLTPGAGIGVYSGPYPKSQGYYNTCTSDATALYSRVSFTFHLQLIITITLLLFKMRQCAHTFVCLLVFIRINPFRCTILFSKGSQHISQSLHNNRGVTK